MEGTYPVIISGDTVGELRVTRRGLYTVFETRFPDPSPGELFRLSVYGDGEGYLGVMTPENGEVSISRRFSRAAMSVLPDKIVFAGRSGITLTPEPEPESEPEPAHEPEPEPPPEPAAANAGDTLWRRLSGGYLMTGTGDSGYIAVPAGAPGVPAGRALSRRVIEGREYMIFEVKNGKAVY